MQEPVKKKQGLCGICPAGCWIEAEYDKKGRIIGVKPDESSQLGTICKIGEHSSEIIYSQHRLKYPLKRKGPKGTYDFERITWDEAFDIIVTKLNYIKKEHGPEAAAIYTGVGSFERAFCDIYQPKDIAVSSASSVLFPYGSPNTMGVGALCYVSYGMIAPHLTMGKMLIDMFNDIDNSELIVVWGTNPATDLPPVEMNKIMEAKTRGAEVVVIDPRRTMTVKLSAAQWVPIRPGTDGALALGLCNILIREELYDEEFVQNWTNGFEEFSQYVQHFRPEVVEHITGVPAETVVNLARKIARANGVSQLMYTGMEYSNSGVQGIRATLVLWALAGQLDVPGGRCLHMPRDHFVINREGHIKNPGDINKRMGADKFPIYIKYRDEAHAISLPKSVLSGEPYRITSLIILGGSIITSWPNPGLWKKTLNSLDFLVCIDRQFTADAAYADIVLPACTYYEIQSYMVYGSLFKIRERMINPVGESRSDIFILAELADRLGYGHLYPQNEEELLRHALKGSGFTLEQVRESNGMVSRETGMMQYKKWEKGLLRQDGKPGFDTPTGKFEIASAILEDYGYDSLPVYTEPQEGPLSRPDLAKSYPLVFNSGARVRTSFHTQHHGIKGLNKDRPEPTVHLNNKDAADRGISNGDMVRIRTLRGAVEMRALVSDDIAAGAIDANHACGSPVGSPAWRDTNINELTDLRQYDPISGFPVYKSLLCEVERVESASAGAVPDTGEITADELDYRKSQTPARTVYLDHNATTPLSEQVKSVMSDTMGSCGNPSSIHKFGRMTRALVDNARRNIARAIHCTARRIVFTGSGSEANNLAIKGVVSASENNRNHIITSQVEHPAVLQVCRWLERKGYRVTYLPVDAQGMVNPDDLDSAIDEHTVVVSIMLANNETGVIQPIKDMIQIAHERGVLFHCDAVQALGKIPLDVTGLDADFVTISAHKVYGPKGVGALYVKKGAAIEPLVNGGGQEYGLRSGTENLTGIVGFGKTAENISAMLEQMDRVRKLRDMLQKGIESIFAECRVNGKSAWRLPNTLSVSLPGFRGESIVLEMDKRGVFLSSGSACSAGSAKPSHALTAMGLTENEAHNSLRLSLGIGNTRGDIEYTLEMLDDVVRTSKNIIRFVPCR
ncbi:MAG: IscS subfamily cysteine desulfurase [Candidatus Aminicenantes bacterium]|nr:MAG: IscS subfamily cysteine desulfurase [Candidatus Aminicenantes bacterium]